MSIKESDWRTFKQVRKVALERLSQRILDESLAVCGKKGLTAHDRYGELYGLIQDRNKDMALAFDDLRRSTAVLQLRLMIRQDLVTKEELSRFHPEIQDRVSDAW